MRPPDIRQAQTPPHAENSVSPRLPCRRWSCRYALPHTLPTFSMSVTVPSSKNADSFSAMGTSLPQLG